MTLDAEAQALLDDVTARMPDKRRSKWQDDWRKPDSQTPRPTNAIKDASRIVNEVMQTYGRTMSGAAQAGAGKRYYGPCRCRKCRP